MSRELDPSPARRWRVGLAIGAWLALVGLGFFALHRYSSAPGEAAEAPARWPGLWDLEQGRMSLVMVIHPQCSCSRASLAELARLQLHVEERVRTDVVFVVPEGAPDDWMASDLWTSAARIPGVTVHRDSGGALAERLGARTSGQTYLYDGRGELRFSGGITPSRSHQGDSVGRQRILALVAGDPGRAESAVYGCEVANDDEPPTQVAVAGETR